VKRFRLDLHLHTALSPCAEAEMTPAAIVAAARSKALDMIAICDHNAAANVAAVQAAAGARPAVIAGIELATREDVHVLGLFPEAVAAEAVAAAVAPGLPVAWPADRERQLIFDRRGAPAGTLPLMLAASTALTLAEAVALIKLHGGLAIAAHVNRPSFSVLSQLGFFPADAGFDAVELFLRRFTPRPAPGEFEFGLPVLTSSDAHFLAEIGAVTTELEMGSPDFAGLAASLRAARRRTDA
jgi:3',5'-nucleoside bisphosphate phosphatase